ncbi:MAG TPA: YbdD/YjiX family protein [Gemmatimonadales bacterium]|nr:YbdD/YjiX family protein [Gemmatimonadales bacterium]
MRGRGNRAAGEVAGGNVRNMRNVGNRAAVEAAEGNVGNVFLTFLRCIAGMPDYRAHVEHLRRCHPESPIPSEREFFEDYLQRRYQNGATRCC